MGGMETIVFAFLSFVFLLVSLIALAGRKALAEAAFGLCVSLSSVTSACYFRLALIDSGKTPAFLGFTRYPFVLPVYLIFTAAGIALFVHGIMRFRRKART